MKANMGKGDRIIRTLLAVTAVILFAAGSIHGRSGLFLMIMSGIFLLTSIIGFCPIYSLFGVSTKRKLSDK